MRPMSHRNSPMMQPGGPMKPLSLVAGSAELPLLRKQTADFAGHRARYGLPVTYEEIPGADHFTIMNEMLSPKGRITTLIRQLFERAGEQVAPSLRGAKRRSNPGPQRKTGLLRRFAPRNDDMEVFRSNPSPR